MEVWSKTARRFATHLSKTHHFQIGRRQVTTLSLASQKRRGKKITMVTAYDFPSAIHVQRANIDLILVGDSCAMVELGYDTTQPVTLDQMLHHCQAVHRGVTAGMQASKDTKANKPLLVGDMPFGSYEYQDMDVALRNAYRMVKEGGMDAVKLEGGSEHRANTVRHVVQGGGMLYVVMILRLWIFFLFCLIGAHMMSLTRFYDELMNWFQ